MHGENQACFFYALKIDIIEKATSNSLQNW